MRSSQGSNIAFREERQPSLAELREANRRRQRRMWLAKRVHGAGWRLTFETFDHLARNCGEDVVDRLLARYAAADLAVLKALGVDEMPISPVRAVTR